MRRVIVESPFAGNVERNVAFARACLRDCLMRGEAPFASHLLYTQPGVLNDNIPEERALGINAVLVWAEKSSKRRQPLLMSISVYQKVCAWGSNEVWRSGVRLSCGCWIAGSFWKFCAGFAAEKQLKIRTSGLGEIRYMVIAR